MAETVKIALGEEWVALSSGEANVLVQIAQSSRAALVAVSEAKPTGDAGIIITDVPGAVSFGDLGESDIVWAKQSRSSLGKHLESVAYVVVVRG